MPTTTMTSWASTTFGLEIRASFPLPGATPASDAPEARVELQLADAERIDAAWSGHAGGHDWPLRIDGEILRVQAGEAGDFLLVHGDRSRFHVSSGAEVVLCDPGPVPGRAWERLLLDTVLWTTALMRGHEALHASAVAIGGGVIGLLGAMGGGKTTLALELLGRGHLLVSDDVLVVEPGVEGILAHPGPPVANVPLGHPALAGMAPERRLAELGDESWVTVPTCAAPRRLAGLLMLERGPGLRDEILPLAATGLDLRRFALVHGLLPGREPGRFELFSDIADRVPAGRLRADLATVPARLADLVETWAAGLTQHTEVPT